MVYSEKQRIWVKDLTVVRVGSKMIWVNDVKRVVKLNRTHVIPQPSDQDKSNISDQLRRLSPLYSHLPPSVLITEVLAPNDPHGASGEFDLAMAEEIVGLLKKEGISSLGASRSRRGSQYIRLPVLLGNQEQRHQSRGLQCVVRSTGAPRQGEEHVSAQFDDRISTVCQVIDIYRNHFWF